MALSRSMLTGMGLTAEQVSAIIEAHTETTDGLKKERDSYKEKADKVASLEKKITELETENTELKENNNGDEWKSKFEKSEADFKAYKEEQESKAVAKAKEEAYKALLKEAGISEKRIATIMKVTDLSDMSLDKDGKFKKADELIESAKNEWADFITTSETKGAETKTPPKTEDSANNSANASRAAKIAAEYHASLYGANNTASAQENTK